jgi:hypothetical protein
MVRQLHCPSCGGGHKKTQVLFQAVTADAAGKSACGYGSPAVSQGEQETSMSDQVNRFLGDSPGRTLVKLIVVSLIVGFVMKIFGWRPMDLIVGVRRFVLDVWHTGFAALGSVGDYLVLGATIVIPLFLLLRIFNYRR